MHLENCLLFYTSAALLFCSYQQAAAQTPGCTVDNGVQSGITCSGDLEVSQIEDFFKELVQLGTVSFQQLRISDNALIQRLPVGFLGELQFTQIWILSCPNLVQVDDFLGASRDTVSKVMLYWNSLSEVPQLTSTTLYELHVYQTEKRVVVRRSAFERSRAIRKLEFRKATVEPFAFLDLKELFSLYIRDISPTPLVAGSFHFASPALGYVELTSYEPWEGRAEPGTFGGITNTTWFRMGAAALVPPAVFFPVFSRSSMSEIFNPIRCDCQVAWIRLSPFLPRTTIRCATETSFVALPDVDEAEFRDCGSSCTRIILLLFFFCFIFFSPSFTVYL
ncbi:oplophorus-luciferin 2-monooxygenase non-catalytic subunit [Penaeus vannamei]|uniref:oplophorus-luciferin 2-monooxygenase non-catalytic subunit n=1 Tax=Penaeus vannamei TaxID=6689 RepID=UPI00387FA2EF